jgi:hypothetical protein
MQGNVTSILEDTGTTLDGIVDAILEDTAAMPSAATIADAVWDEAATGHTDAGKAGAQMWTDIDAILDDTDLIDDGTSGLAKIATDVAAILVDTNTTIPGTITTMQGNVTSILEDTGTTLDTLVRDIPNNAEFADRTLLAASYATAAALTTVDNEIAVIDGIVDAILLDTAEIGTAGAGLTALASAANLATAYLLIRYMAPPLIGTIANAGEGTETYVYGGVTVTYTVNEDGDRAVVAIT